MEKKEFNTIIENIITIKPILINNLVNPAYNASLYSTGTINLLLILDKYHLLSMSDIGKELCMPKPNVTALIDKIISKGLINRLQDEKDRRVIQIHLTQKGAESVEEIKNNLKENIKQKLLNLNEEELDLLSFSLRNVKNILVKIASK